MSQNSLLNSLTKQVDNINNDDLYTMHDEIKSHLELLLNTRSSTLSCQPEHKQLDQSIVNYGVPDFMDIQYGSEKSQQKLCDEIRRVIQNYEPRLQNINISFIESENKDRVLRLHIEATISYENESTPVAFESYIDPLNQSFKLS